MILEGDMRIRSADVVACAMVGFNNNDSGGDSGGDRIESDEKLVMEEERCNRCRLR